ncbi:hypothetical protein IFM89_034283 [Coptis chinensis]|uniref:Cytochrome P450 n=1 Tax=Coptis chinensis TaxID=261450 RepID=A0A835IIP3_9MAGN|nr:hypothetical protein IFM89_034283 [Coptis chinensis]
MFSKPSLWLREWIYQEDEDTRGVATLIVLFIVITLYTWKIKISKKRIAPLPPGPRGLLLVGNLPFLEPDLNRYFADLAKIYGPIFKVQLGTRLCVVLSAPYVAKEVLKDHDITFANHDAPAMGISSSYGGVDMVWSPYGEHWRMLRKVSVTQLLSNFRLESLYEVRRREGHQMVEVIKSMIGVPIAIHDYVNATLFDILTGMLWGGSLVVGEERKRITSEFRKFSQQLVDLCGEPNISDVFPFLALFDLQRKDRKMKKLMLWFDGILDQVIDQRLAMKTEKDLDFLQVLLQCRDQVDQKSTPLKITHIKALLMDIFVDKFKGFEWAVNPYELLCIVSGVLLLAKHLAKFQNNAASFNTHNPVLKFRRTDEHAVLDFPWQSRDYGLVAFSSVVAAKAWMQYLHAALSEPLRLHLASTQAFCSRLHLFRKHQMKENGLQQQLNRQKKRSSLLEMEPLNTPRFQANGVLDDDEYVVTRKNSRESGSLNVFNDQSEALSKGLDVGALVHINVCNYSKPPHQFTLNERAQKAIYKSIYT